MMMMASGAMQWTRREGGFIARSPTKRVASSNARGAISKLWQKRNAKNNSPITWQKKVICDFEFQGLMSSFFTFNQKDMFSYPIVPNCLYVVKS